MEMELMPLAPTQKNTQPWHLTNKECCWSKTSIFFQIYVLIRPNRRKHGDLGDCAVPLCKPWKSAFEIFFSVWISQFKHLSLVPALNTKLLQPWDSVHTHMHALHIYVYK